MVQDSSGSNLSTGAAPAAAIIHSLRLAPNSPPAVLLLSCCRDRRYEYKGLTKVWKGKLDSAKVRLGLADADDGFCVSKATLYMWKGKLDSAKVRWAEQRGGVTQRHALAEVVQR